MFQFLKRDKRLMVFLPQIALSHLGETGAKWTVFLLFGRIFLTATRDKKIFAQRDPPLSLLF